MADLSATTKIETLIITVCWTDFHIKQPLETFKNMILNSKRIMEPEAMESIEEVAAYDKLTLKYLTILHNGFIETVINASPDHGSFLEVGCGTGRISIGVAKHTENISITSIDLSDNMLKVAKNNAKAEKVDEKIQFLRTNGNNIPFKNNSFDAVFCHNMLHHISNPLPVLNEMARVVTKDGAFIVRDLIRKSRLFAWLHVNFFGLTYNKLMKEEYKNSILAAFSKKEWEEILKNINMDNLFLTSQFITHQGIERQAANKRDSIINIPLTSFIKKILKNKYVS